MAEQGERRSPWTPTEPRFSSISTSELGPGIVYLHERGALLNTTLATAHAFEGVPVSARERVTLDEDGRLVEHSQRLEADQPVGGLPCSAEFHAWVCPDGRPSVVVLASPSVVGGREYPRGAELFLDEGGQVVDWRQVDLDSGHSSAGSAP